MLKRKLNLHRAQSEPIGWEEQVYNHSELRSDVHLLRRMMWQKSQAIERSSSTLTFVLTHVYVKARYCCDIKKTDII